MSIAVASLLGLIVVGALAGLLFFRSFGQAARGEGQTGSGNDEGGDEAGSLSQETRRSVWYFVGLGAVASAILVDLVAVASAFGNAQEFLNNVAPTVFLAFMFAVIGYFLGARMLAVGAMIFTVIAIAAGAVVTQGML